MANKKKTELKPIEKPALDEEKKEDPLPEITVLDRKPGKEKPKAEKK